MPARVPQKVLSRERNVVLLLCLKKSLSLQCGEKTRQGWAGGKQNSLGGSGSLKGRDHGGRDYSSHSRESKYGVRKRSQGWLSELSLNNWVTGVEGNGDFY